MACLSARRARECCRRGALAERGCSGSSGISPETRWSPACPSPTGAPGISSGSPLLNASNLLAAEAAPFWHKERARSAMSGGRSEVNSPSAAAVCLSYKSRHPGISMPELAMSAKILATKGRDSMRDATKARLRSCEAVRMPKPPCCTHAMACLAAGSLRSPARMCERNAVWHWS